METIVRNVQDLDDSVRVALERLVGHSLHISQQVVIQLSCVQSPADSKGQSSGTQLPEWCNVYEGLSDAEIDELDRAIVRAHSSRNIG